MIRDIAGLMILYDILYIVCFVRQPRFFCGGSIIFVRYFYYFCASALYFRVAVPIWWGISAWPVDSFVKANDFAGKVVIPFCTSSSSDLGESGELLAEMAGTGEWQEGMRFSSGVSDEDVKAWVESLGL